MAATIHAYRQVEAAFGASPRTSAAFTAPTAGRSLLVIVRNSSIGNISALSPALTDNAGNTYVLDDILSINTTTNQAVFRCQSVSGSPTTWTFSWTGGTTSSIYFYSIEVSGLAASPFLRISSTATAFGTNSSTSYTTVEANELAFGRLVSDGTSFAGVGGMTVEDDTVGTFQNSLYNADLSTAGSKTLGATWTTSQTWHQQLAFYSSGAAPAGGATIINMM